MIDERGADYVPNDSVNSLSCCINPFGDTSDQIQRDTVIEEIKCRLGCVRCISVPRMRRVLMRTSDFASQHRAVPAHHYRRHWSDGKIDF